MHKYEIMLIVQSTTTEDKVNSFISEIFSSKGELKKLERTQLAYAIKKVNTAQYFVLNIEAKAEEIKEFGRKALLDKEILRTLVINLDSEKALQRKPKQNRVRKPKFAPRSSEQGARRSFKKTDDRRVKNEDKNSSKSEE
ncbi:30S ribosomal protein S6 [Mycoplasma phocoenae]|uniref:Small ribosomal subunit protein bS6 n=1 Tax=Mycoplasma phocoenae TaxID=754517 RepID=A0A858U316_9MOLU|nr:30S ribosomal protein S6 [Mycoplasma phocoenae]QJG66812.1 30S ribosomal protein S6 [Mycoplasma phocoenae]